MFKSCIYLIDTHALFINGHTNVRLLGATINENEIDHKLALIVIIVKQI